jgi:prepilin-type N-terminal cleavage/methylation domain-containing protein
MTPNRRARGLTLAELLIAMTVMSVIGLAVTGVAMALSSAHAASEAYNQYVQTGRVAMARVTQKVRGSSLIVSADAQRLVLWSGDANADGRISLDEVAVITYDGPARQVRHYAVEFPDHWPNWMKALLNSSLELRSLSSAASVEWWLSRHWLCQTTVLADDVLDFSPSVSPAAPLSTIASVEMTVGDDAHEVTLHNAAGLRADKTSHVYESDDEFFLDTE